MTPGSNQTNELWKQVQQNDRQAFDAIYREYVQVIFSTIYNHTGHRQDSMDLVQETFLDLWEKRQSIQIQGAFFNYLYSIARYKTLRYIKENTNRMQVEITGMEPDVLPVVAPDMLTGAALLRTEEMIKQEINTLPAQMKKVYELHTVDNMTVHEIATRLLLSPNTVKNHLVKARKRLRDVISRLLYLLLSLLMIILPMLPKY